MTTPKKNTLGERLKQQMEAESEKSADLIAGALKSFESDLNAQLQNALNTTEGAIKEHMSLIRMRLSRMQPSDKWTPPAWMIASFVASAIILTALSLWWAMRSMETTRFERMGIYWNNKAEARPVILLDREMLSITTCSLSGREFYCLRAAKNNGEE